MTNFTKTFQMGSINLQLLLIHDKILSVGEEQKCSLKFPVSELNRIYLKFKEISDFLMEREVFQRRIIIDKDLEPDNLGITTANFNDFYDAFYN
ncbi:BPK_collapsed_G0022570.mRNA.1.CDS.1 [Saccharomyces cerevisiae]|nr:BPK_collapsed_G0022570.mRNA.1.CDS.1 [Saccharomyces cerevisiae]